jgi:hypothetical protein
MAVRLKTREETRNSAAALCVYRRTQRGGFPEQTTLRRIFAPVPLTVVLLTVLG